MRAGAVILLIAVVFASLAPCRMQAAVPDWVRVDNAAPGMNLEISRPEQVEVTVNDGTVYLYTATEMTVKIFTILGQQITVKKLTPGLWSFKLNARGIYILKAGTVTKRLSV